MPVAPLHPVLLGSLVQDMLDALPQPPQATPQEIADRRTAALASIATLRPRDVVEAMLAARSVIAHFTTMDAFRCALQPNLPLETVLRLRGKAVVLARLMDTTLRDLEQRRNAAPLPAAEVPLPMPVAHPPAAPAAAAEPQADRPPDRAAPPVAPSAGPPPVEAGGTAARPASGASRAGQAPPPAGKPVAAPNPAGGRHAAAPPAAAPPIAAVPAAAPHLGAAHDAVVATVLPAAALHGAAPPAVARPAAMRAAAASSATTPRNAALPGATPGLHAPLLCERVRPPLPGHPAVASRAA